MQVDPIKPTLKAPGTKRLNLKNDEPLSNFGFKFNLRPYSMENEFCHNCNLKLCGTDMNPDCEFSVHIRGNAKYFILLYGVTDKEADGATITLAYVPPQGRAVHVGPMEPTLKAPRTQRLKLKYDVPLSNFALKFNLRRYSKGACTSSTARRRMTRARASPVR